MFTLYFPSPSSKTNEQRKPSPVIPRRHAATLILFALLGAKCAGAQTAPQVPPVPEKAAPADRFVESIGVGTRFDWMLNDKQLDKAQAALQWTGIRYIRAGVGREGGDINPYIEAMRKLARETGVNVCLNVGWDSRAQIEDGIRRWTAAPSSVDALEGVNESFTPPDWAAKNWQTALDVQKYLWEQGKAKNLRVYSWTLGGPAGFYKDMPREADAFMTHANFHPYHWYANPAFRGNTKMNGLWQNTETPQAAGCIAAVRELWLHNPTKPLVSTEWGWGLDTIKGAYDGVDPLTQGKYITRGLLENFNAGLERGYIYSLFPHNDDFGIMNRDGTPRPAASGIKALIALLGEKGKANAPTRSLAYMLTIDSGLKTTDNHDLRDEEIHHTLLQKKGAFYLVLWADKDSQHGSTRPEPATLTLPAGAKHVRVFRPLTDGTTAIAVLPKVPKGGTVRLANQTAIPDHPLVLEITP